MIVCVCRRVACAEIRGAAEGGCVSFEAFCEQRQLGLQCGRCRDTARALFERPQYDAAPLPVAPAQQGAGAQSSTAQASRLGR
jgi:bacterioferritin-associated ferredoxin